MPSPNTKINRNFSELNLENLKIFAKNWAADWKDIQIEKISLYRMNIPIQDRAIDALSKKGRIKPWTPTQYAVVFESSNFPDISEEAVDSVENEEDDQFLKFMKTCRSAGSHKGHYHPFFDSSFERLVYNQPSRGDYRKEWKFTCKRPDDELSPLFYSNYFEVIYISKLKLPAKVLDLIRQSHPEILRLYSAILEVGLKNSYDWEDAVKREYKKNISEFKLVKESDLNDNALYSLNAGKERRDFVSFLLQKILKENNAGSFGVETVYSGFKMFDSPT